jgi:peptidoglycan/xylan/chitin deacetylase (PgdA/CDA1 family)
VSALRSERVAWKRPLIALLAAFLLGASDQALDGHGLGHGAPIGHATHDIEAVHREPREPWRPPIRGTDFPDGVLALTWDDGPDANTLELARWLHERRVAGTFFVVGEWIDGVSDEPGVGTGVYATGHRHLPVLRELAALGHRIGNHTENHALLDGAPTAAVAAQLAQDQHAIDPFLRNELRMFRVPGGAWSGSATAALADPLLRELVGPFRWDIDGKDWESSLYCRAAPDECEPGPIPGRTRVRPDVVARRYVARAEGERRGIVLLHDRVGHVGSRYALDVARELVPALEARGFVFAAPVLEFGPLARRLTIAKAARDASLVSFADLDGDGHADLCRDELGELACAREETAHDAAGMPRAAFGRLKPTLRLPETTRAMDVADVDGDGRADVCVVDRDDVSCAIAGPHGFRPLRRWSAGVAAWPEPSLRLADVDGDGRADACARSGDAIVCARSTGKSFGAPGTWLAHSSLAAGDRLELADLDGDGRADVCGLHLSSGEAAPDGVACARSNGRRFAASTRWSAPGDLAGPAVLRLGDLNGDGRADVCAGASDGVTCALSSGRDFKRASRWSTAPARGLRLADVNGDRRADMCVVTSERVDCGLAP